VTRPRDTTPELTALDGTESTLVDPASGDLARATTSTLRKFFSLPNVLDYGAKNDNTGTAQTGFAAAAAAAAAAGGGLVRVPAGDYRFTAMFDQPETVSFISDGPAAATIHPVGAITAWRYKPASGVTYIRDSIAGIGFRGTSSTVAALQVSDCFGYLVRDVTIEDCTAGVGLLSHNINAWTEGLTLDNVHLANNAVGLRYQRTSGSGGTDSVGYGRWKNLFINVPVGAIGVDLGQGGALNLYASHLVAVIWINTNGTGVRVQSGSTIDGLFMVDGEKEVASSGTVGVNNSGVVTGLGRFEMSVDGNTFGAFKVIAQYRDGMSGSSGGVEWQQFATSQLSHGYGAGFGFRSGDNVDDIWFQIYEHTNNKFRFQRADFGTQPTASVEVASIDVNGAMDLASFLQLREGAEPAAPAANRARLFLVDNGSGKTQLKVRFATGASQTIATEP